MVIFNSYVNVCQRVYYCTYHELVRNLDWQAIAKVGGTKNIEKTLWQLKMTMEHPNFGNAMERQGKLLGIP